MTDWRASLFMRAPSRFELAGICLGGRQAYARNGRLTCGFPRGFIGRGDMDLTVLAHGHAAFGHEAQHFGIQDVLDLVDAGFEVVVGIVLAHLHGALRHDGAFVVVLVREVDGDARHFHARVERVLDGVRALERGQQRRMQVQHAVGERVQQHGRHLAHVPCHHHVLGVRVAQRLGDAPVGFDGVGVHVAVEHRDRDARPMRALDAERIGARRHHVHDLHGQPLGRRIDDGLQIRAAAAQQHADFQRFGHALTPPHRSRTACRRSRSGPRPRPPRCGRRGTWSRRPASARPPPRRRAPRPR